MKGSVRKRGKKYQYRFHIRDPITNERKEISKTFDSKKDAERALTLALAEYEKGTFVADQKILFPYLVDMWLENKAGEVRPSTMYSYKRVLKARISPEFERLKILDIKPLHIHNFYQKLKKEGLSTRYISYVSTILKNVFDFAESLEFISSNPARKVSKPKGEKKKQSSWTVEQANLFLEHSKLTARHYIAYFLALHTGMRIGEVLGLMWSDIEGNKIHVRRTITLHEGKYTLGDPKTYSSTRTIAVSDTVIRVLEEHRQHQKEENPLDLVVCTRNGKLVNPYTLRYKMKEICERIDLPLIRFHDLRRTHTSILIDQGINPKVVAERLGHTNITMTLDIYTDVYEDKKNEAAATIEKALNNVGGQSAVKDS